MIVQALKFFHKLKQFAPANDKKHFDVVEQALEEVEQYRALGTVEELKEAREKQVEKKPLADSYGEIGMGFLVPICPNCRKPVEEGEHHCECGQALDWGEEDA